MFHQTIIGIEVLSKEPLPENMTLADVLRKINEGDYSGKELARYADEVDGPTMAKLLLGQGSDPEFFGLSAEVAPCATLPATIDADAISDDRAIDIKFNAVPWFRATSAESILALVGCGWGGDYPADAVVTYVGDYDENVERLLSYIDTAHEVGYECHVDEESAMAWLKEHRPEVHEIIKSGEEANNG